MHHLLPILVFLALPRASGRTAAATRRDLLSSPRAARKSTELAGHFDQLLSDITHLETEAGADAHDFKVEALSEEPPLPHFLSSARSVARGSDATGPIWKEQLHHETLAYEISQLRERQQQLLTEMAHQNLGANSTNLAQVVENSDFNPLDLNPMKYIKPAMEWLQFIPFLLVACFCVCHVFACIWSDMKMEANRVDWEHMMKERDPSKPLTHAEKKKKPRNKQEHMMDFGADAVGLAKDLSFAQWSFIVQGAACSCCLLGVLWSTGILVPVLPHLLVFLTVALCACCVLSMLANWAWKAVMVIEQDTEEAISFVLEKVHVIEHVIGTDFEAGEKKIKSIEKRCGC